MPANLVGRDREAGVLSDCRRDAADSHGRIVLVAGEAGIGKSQLLRHLEATVAGTRSACALARCVEFVQTPLSPLSDLLSQLKVRGSVSEEAATAEVVSRLTPDRTEVPQGGPLPVGSLFDAIDRVLAQHALRRTIVLLVEDIHWADRSTLDFLSFLADRIARRRMLVVATYRSEEFEAAHVQLANIAALLRKGTVEVLELRPLDEHSSRALVQTLLPRSDALGSPAIADIVRRSQGNPFFLEELVKGALASDPAAVAARLPLSIRGAVLARAALLPREDREILSLGAVLGERFSVERLVALQGAARDPVLKALERARALQLVYDVPDEIGTIAFRHGLTQEVLYDELLAERIRPLHERIALELERRPEAAALCIELAHHWRRAGDLARSAAYSQMAGDRAFALGAMADAILYYERALADGAGEAATATLSHKLGLAFGLTDRLDAGIERLRRAGECYWRLGDLEGFAQNASALGAQLYNSGDPVAATSLHREAIEALAPRLPTEKLDVLRARIAFNCIAALDLDSALGFLNEIREPVVNPLTASHVYQTKFKVAAMRGDAAQWRRDSERALEAARRIDDGGSRLRHTQCQVALDAVGLGEINLATQSFRAAMQAGSKNAAPERSLAAAASSFEHTLRGDFRAAGRLLEESARAEQRFALLLHVRGAQLALAICTGDVARLRRDDTEPLLHHAATHGMNLALGLLGGPYAWALGIRGEFDAAAAWIARIAAVSPGPHRFLFAYLAAAQFGNPDDVAAMREQLAEAAARPNDRVNAAALGLFDAFAGSRGIVPCEVEKCAHDAAERFEGNWLAVARCARARSCG